MSGPAVKNPAAARRVAVIRTRINNLHYGWRRPIPTEREAFRAEVWGRAPRGDEEYPSGGPLSTPLLQAHRFESHALEERRRSAESNGIAVVERDWGGDAIGSDERVIGALEIF